MWHWLYLDTEIVWHWHFLTLTLIEFGNFRVVKNFCFHLFIFFDISFFLIFFLIWKMIKETDKSVNKRIHCSLSKQWLIHQQLLSYCIGRSKIYKKFHFKAKSSDLKKLLLNSASGIFMQQYIILWIVCFFVIVKTVSLLK